LDLKLNIITNKNFLIASIFSLSHYGVIANDLPKVTAQAWLVADSNGSIIQGTNTTDIRSIASITKLMTAMVVLDSDQSLHEVLPKKLHQQNLSRLTLINLAIVKSDNTAAKMLCDYYRDGYTACIKAMNEKAKSLGMDNTEFTDPTGLYHTNVSTAEDLIKLVTAASKYPIIVEASNMDAVRWNTTKKKQAVFVNTNSLVRNGHYFIVSKTGWITKSGGCIVMMMVTSNGVRTVVLLGSKNTKTRIPEAHLIAMRY
jgi:D-alanyl-D-alanine endopeptidase (penicillin-binding protein 7)